MLTLLVVLAVIAVLDLAVLRFGTDSRDGSDRVRPGCMPGSCS